MAKCKSCGAENPNRIYYDNNGEYGCSECVKEGSATAKEKSEEPCDKNSN